MNEYIVLFEKTWGRPPYETNLEVMHIVWADNPDDAARTIHTAYLLTPDDGSISRIVGVMRTQTEYPASTIFNPQGAPDPA